MAETFDDLYSNLRGNPEFSELFSNPGDFETFLKEEPNADQHMKELFNVENATTYLKKKDEGDVSTSNSLLGGINAYESENVVEKAPVPGPPKAKVVAKSQSEIDLSKQVDGIINTISTETNNPYKALNQLVELNKKLKNPEYRNLVSSGKIGDKWVELNQKINELYKTTPMVFDSPQTKQLLKEIGAQDPSTPAFGQQPQFKQGTFVAPATDYAAERKQAQLQRTGDIAQRGLSKETLATQEQQKKSAASVQLAQQQDVIAPTTEFNQLTGRMEEKVSEAGQWGSALQGIENELRSYDELRDKQNSQDYSTNDEQEFTERRRSQVENEFIGKLEPQVNDILKDLKDNFVSEKEVEGEGIYFKRDRDGFLAVNPGYLNEKVDAYIDNQKPGDALYLPDTEEGNKYKSDLKQAIKAKLAGDFNADLSRKIAEGRIGTFDAGVIEAKAAKEAVDYINKYDGRLESEVESYVNTVYAPVLKYEKEEQARLNADVDQLNSLVQNNTIDEQTYLSTRAELQNQIEDFTEKSMNMRIDASAKANTFLQQRKNSRVKDLEAFEDQMEVKYENLTKEAYNNYKKKFIDTLEKYRNEQQDANAAHWSIVGGMIMPDLSIMDNLQSSLATIANSAIQLSGIQDFNVDFVDKTINTLSKIAVGNQYMGRSLSNSRSFIEGLGAVTQQLIDQVPTIGTAAAMGIVTRNPYLTSAFMMYTDLAREAQNVQDDIIKDGGTAAQAQTAKKKVIDQHLLMTPLYFGQGSLLTGAARKAGSTSFAANYFKGLAMEYPLELTQEVWQEYTGQKFTGALKKTDGTNKTFGEWLASDGSALAVDLLPTVALLGGAQALSETSANRKIIGDYESVSKFLGDKQLSQFVSDTYNVMGENMVNLIPQHLRATGQINDAEFKDLSKKFKNYVGQLADVDKIGLGSLDDSRYYLYQLSEIERVKKDLDAAVNPSTKKALQNKIDGLQKSVDNLIEGKEVNYVKFKFSNGASFVMSEEDAAKTLKDMNPITNMMGAEITNKKGEAVPMLTMETSNSKLNAAQQEIFKRQEKRKEATGVTGVNIGEQYGGAAVNNNVKMEGVVASASVSEANAKTRLEEARLAQTYLDEQMPGVKIVMFNDKDYKGFMPKVKGKVDSAGNIAIKYNEQTKKYEVEIHINLDKANSRTIGHEVTHAVLLKSFGEDIGKFTEFRQTMSKLLSDSDNKALSDFGRNYAIDVQAEEYLAELSGLMQSSGKTIEKGVVLKMMTYISDFVSKLTGGKVQPFKNVQNINEAVDFFNSLTEKLSTVKNAVQEQTAGQVPVQPETRVGEEVAQGESQAETQVAPQEGQEEVANQAQIQDAQIQVNTPNNEEIETGDIVISGYVNPSEIESKSQVPGVFQPVDISWEVDPASGMTLRIPEERKSMYNVVSTSGGAIVVANSDGTGIGKVVDGQILQGGFGYSLIDQNVEDEIGFAASDDAKILSIWEAAQEAARLRDEQNPEMAGKPVAVLVMIQAPSATFGNAYAATYFGNVLKAISKDKNYETTKAKNELIEFINDFRTTDEYGRKYNDAFAELISIIRNTDFKKPEAIDKITNILITEKKRGLPKGTSQAVIAENNKRFGFDARRAFFEKFFVGTGKANPTLTNSTTKETRKNPGFELRNYLKEKGFGQEGFYEKYVDQNIMNNLQGPTPGKRLADGGFAMSGFFIDPNLSKEEFVRKSKEGTFKHKQFNSKFYGTDPFLLNGKYYVNEMFPEARFVASEKKGGKDIPVQASAALSLYPRTRRGQAADVVARAKEIDDFMSKSQKVRSEKSSGTTQVATTTGSYVKAANLIKDIQGSVLDYGAGLGLGTDAMSNTLGRKVDSYEPNPERWQGKEEATYTGSDQINKKYDGIVSLNVLNVVPKDIRDAIVGDIFDKLNVGGKAVISTRKWSGDVNAAKNAVPGAEEKSLIITRRQDGKDVEVFQKGFDGNELVDYVQSLLGDAAEVVKNNTFGAAGVIITKNAETGFESKSQIDNASIAPEYQNAIASGKTPAEAYGDLIKTAYTNKAIKDALGNSFDQTAYDAAVEKDALATMNTLEDAMQQNIDDVKDVLNQNYISLNDTSALSDIRSDLKDQGYSDLSIFTAFLQMDFATPEQLQEVFGAEYRKTVQDALNRKTDFSSDFLAELSENDQNLKIKNSAEDLTNAFVENGLTFIDAAVGIEYLLNYLDKAGLLPMAATLRDSLKNVKNDQQEVTKFFETFSQLSSMAGRILNMARFIFERQLGEMISDSLKKNGIVLTAAQEKELENLIGDFNLANQQVKENQKALEQDFSDDAFNKLWASEKELGFANTRLFQFLDARKPNFWNDRITSGGSRGLLNFGTTVLSFTANIENNLYSTNAITRGIQKLRDNMGNGITGNTLSMKNWRLARQLTKKKSSFAMSQAFKYGNVQDVNALNKYYDGLGQINFFRDASWTGKFVRHFVKQVSGKEPLTMTDEEFADAFDQTLIRMKDGDIKLRDGRAYTIAKSFFWTISIGPQASELTGRVMAYGGDIMFGQMATQRAIIDYLSNIKDTRFQDGYFENQFAQANGNLNEEAIRAMSVMIYSNPDLKKKFEEEGLKRTLLADNIISKGASLLRGATRKKISSLYKEISVGQKGLLSSENLAKQTLQVSDVLLWTLMPFTKVPANFLGSAIMKAMPGPAVIKYAVSEFMYQKALDKFNEKHKVGKKYATENEKQNYEKDKIDLFAKKRQVTYDFAQIATATALQTFALSAVKAGAILLADDEEKNKNLKGMNLRGGLYNASLHAEYLFATSKNIISPVTNYLGFTNQKPINTKAWIASRGGYAKPGDKIMNLNNAGFVGYSMGLWGAIMQGSKNAEQASVLSFDQYNKEGLLNALNYAVGSGVDNLPMFQGVARIGELLQDKSKVEGSDKLSNFLIGEFTTSLAVFFPSFGSFVSKGNGDLVQNARDIIPSKEDSWAANYGKVVLGTIQRLNRNVAFDERTKNPYYEAMIGPFGEDLSYRVTVAEPGTLGAYAQAMFDPFAIRKYSLPVKEANKDKQLHIRSAEVHAGLMDLAMMYQQLSGRDFEFKVEGKSASIFQMISSPVYNDFSYDGTDVTLMGPDSNRNPKVLNYNLPNDLYRQELKERGKHRAAAFENWRQDVVDTKIKVSTLIQNGEYEQAEALLEETINKFKSRSDEANEEYKRQYVENRQKDYFIIMKRRGLVTEDMMKQLQNVGIADSQGLISK